VSFKKISLTISLVILISIFSLTLFTSQSWERGQLLSTVLSKNLENFHYSGKKINDDFSQKAFHQYIKFMDPNKSYFLKTDIEEFSKYRDKIDEFFVSGNIDFLTLINNRLIKRVKEVQGFYKHILSNPFDFNRDEYIELDREKRDYCTDLGQLKENWRKILKNQTLIRFINLVKSRKKKDSKKNLQKRVQEEVKKSLGYGLNRKLQSTKNDRLADYFKMLLSVFDPHTTYLAPIDKENFDLEMSGTFQGIGALLTEEDGHIKIVEIIPGGPSWKQGLLQPNDIILKVAQGNGEPVDISGMRTIDAVKFIRGKKGTTVNLTVQKTDGRIIVISIVRDIVVVEETFAKSAIIKDERSNKSFGYINLRRFYNDFNNKDGRTSSKDVRIELNKLKEKSISGLILDLRNNSGGSLQDAVEITGLFIPKGPIVQTKSRMTSRIRVMKDPDPETIYSGPLVILINRFSASAAEILAAALQDYGRAIIIGGSHSFGKGTVQIIVDLNQFLRKKSKDMKPLGSLKITIYKFYRINGTSNQYNGVLPDIEIPDIFNFMEVGEKYYDFSLKSDTISPAKFEKWKSDPNIKQLQINSKNRISKNDYFKALSEYLEKSRLNSKKTRKSLQIQKALKEQQLLKHQIDVLNKMEIELPNLKVTSASMANISPKPLDKVALDRQKQFFSSLKKDYFLNEATAILNDLIKK